MTPPQPCRKSQIAQIGLTCFSRDVYEPSDVGVPIRVLCSAHKRSRLTVPLDLQWSPPVNDAIPRSFQRMPPLVCRTALPWWTRWLQPATPGKEGLHACTWPLVLSYARCRCTSGLKDTTPQPQPQAPFHKEVDQLSHKSAGPCSTSRHPAPELLVRF
jgi:hypothetical protein